MQFRKAANRLGFTRTEFIVITSLAGIFLAGLFIKYFLNSPGPAPYRDFDYSKSDSLFLAIPDSSADEENGQSFTQPAEKAGGKNAPPEELRVEAAERRSVSYKKKILAEENSIDINRAGKDELLRLPGIGEKTAERIIELRGLKGRFNSTDDLLEVKGIGASKMNKIRKYIFVK